MKCWRYRGDARTRPDADEAQSEQNTGSEQRKRLYESHDLIFSKLTKADNVCVIPDAGDVETVGPDKIAKLSAETSEDWSVAAWVNVLLSRVVGFTSTF